jgi:hypothetical protein
MANYLVITLSNRTKAETAYTALEQAKFPLAQVQLIGQGYQSLDTYPLYDPSLAIRQQVQRMAIWLLPFGFFAGYGFNQITELTIFPNLSPLMNGVIGGLMGAVSGAMGGFAAGGGFKLFNAQERQTFQARLNLGQYLLVVTGDEVMIQRAITLLRPQRAERVQVFEAAAVEPKKSPALKN